ncbi:MAG: VanW family protein, partial [Clostridiales bacterium]|nr:VanW family protein [Clostridiales bacterium]
KKLNGAVVLPGESFSFNERVGARSEANGFKTAKIIVGGEYTEGIGGGVCQVSTTLYNAALLAGMRVTAVRGHTIQPSYVPPSLDAMVNSSTSDLCFVNPFDTPVFIAAETDSDESVAVVTFYGHVLPYTIKAVSREITHASVPADREEVDKERKYVGDAPAGTRVRVSYGHAKVTSESFLRYFTLSGQFIKEEKIRTDTYAETKGLIAVAP